MSDESDYKDYQDYLAYQKAQSGEVPQSEDIPAPPDESFGDHVSRSFTNAVNSGPAIRSNMMEGIAGNAMGATMAPGLSKLLKPVGSVITNAARRSGVLDKVKSGVGLARDVKDQISGALGQYSEKAIKPQAEQLRQLLSGKSVQVAPSEIQGVDPVLDRYAKQLWKKNLNTTEPSMTGQSLPNIPVDIQANVANKIKQKAASAANYAKSKPFSEGSAAREKSAEEIAANMRSKVSSVDPQVDEINRGLQDKIQTRNRIAEASDTSPIETIQGRIGGTKSSLISDIDQAAGTKLGQTGRDIELAQSRLGQKDVPQSFAALMHRGLGVAPRIGGATAQGLEPLMRFLRAHPEAAGNILSRPTLDPEDQ